MSFFRISHLKWICEKWLVFLVYQHFCSIFYGLTSQTLKFFKWFEFNSLTVKKGATNSHQHFIGSNQSNTQILLLSENLIIRVSLYILLNSKKYTKVCYRNHIIYEFTILTSFDSKLLNCLKKGNFSVMSFQSRIICSIVIPKEIWKLKIISRILRIEFWFWKNARCRSARKNL